MKLNCTIIGCGWLGKVLAIELIKSEYIVFGSTRTEKKMTELSTSGISAFLFNDSSPIPTEIIEKTDVVVLSIPPVRREEPSFYGNYLSTLAKQFTPSTRFVFLGSTGIYPQKSGVFNENYMFTPSEKNNALYHAEEQLKTCLGERITLLRLGGLIGEDRNPIRSLSGKVDVKNPHGVINFVHRKDVIRLILTIFEKNTFGQVFNVVYPLHPYREEYFTDLAKKLRIPTPSFDYSTSIKREISSQKLTSDFGFTFENSIQ